MHQTGGSRLISVALLILGPPARFSVVDPYTTKRWTVSITGGTIILSAPNVRSNSDDGIFSLTLFSVPASGVPISRTGQIRLKVLVPPYYPSSAFYTSGEIVHNEGDLVTIMCRPKGSPEPIQITWLKNGVNYASKDTNDPDLVFNNVTRIDIGQYVCLASNEAGAAQNRPSTKLVVKYKPVNTKLNVSSVLVQGQANSLVCSAIADPRAKYRIGGAGIREIPDSLSGRVDFVAQLSVHDGKTVRCTPWNNLGSGPPAQLLLDVQVPAKVLAGLPQLMKAIEGRNFSVSCFASGKPGADIIWLKNGAPLRNPPVTYHVGTRFDNTYETKSTLTLAPARREDNGRYACRAYNPYGRDIKTTILNLLYLPEIIHVKDFASREVRVRTRVSLNCRAQGNPVPTFYVWRWQNGTVIQNRTTGQLEFPSIRVDEGGRLSCAGVSGIGEGPKQYVDVLVRVPPRIIFFSPRQIFLNESERLQLFCNASGVPEPTIQWSQDGIILPTMGERFIYYSVKYTDAGIYTCTAYNGMEPNATAWSNVTIYFRPVILTTSPIATQKGAVSGTPVTLACGVKALPTAHLEWLSYPSLQPLNISYPDVINIRQSHGELIEMQVKARIGAKYLCHASNNRGNASQLYEIRAIGRPEAPTSLEVETFIHNAHDQLSTVHAHLRWTPGYDGGQTVWYKVFYGPRDSRLQSSPNIKDCNCYTIKDGLQANTFYVFYVQAQNNAGLSNSSEIETVKTKAFYGQAQAEKFQGGKIVKVTFLIYTEKNLTKKVRYREKGGQWIIRDVEPGKQTLIIEDLDPLKHYEFQILWYAEGKLQITHAGEVGVEEPPPKGRGGGKLSREEIIAIIAGVGGFLLIVILVLFLCLIRRRHKPKRDETVVVMRRQPHSADIITRRSLIGSVEDDPFESAHYKNQDKKKARDSYYLPNSDDMNTFSSDNTAKHSLNPAENSQAYQPYVFGKKEPYDDDNASSEDDSYPVKGGKISDDELSSEPGYARVDDVVVKEPRDNFGRARDRRIPNSDAVYAKISKKDNNNQGTANGRGAPPPYRPRSSGDAPRGLPAYQPPQAEGEDLDLDDPAGVPYEDTLPPPMPVLPNSHSVPDGIWNDRYQQDAAARSANSPLERDKSSSRSSLGGKPYINAQGKLVRPGSSGRLSSSGENFNDSVKRSPEPEVPSGRTRQLDLDNDGTNLVSYLV